MTNLVLTLIGPDRPGLVEAVADVIARNGGNWLESRMAHLAGKFTGILRAEVAAEKVEALRRELQALESSGLRIVVESGDAAEEKPRRLMELDLVGLDRPGIVREISRLLAESKINVEELETDRQSAPMSGEMLFSAKARVSVPAGVELSELRSRLGKLATDLMVEIRLLDAPAPKGR